MNYIEPPLLDEPLALDVLRSSPPPVPDDCDEAYTHARSTTPKRTFSRNLVDNFSRHNCTRSVHRRTSPTAASTASGLPAKQTSNRSLFAKYAFGITDDDSAGRAIGGARGSEPQSKSPASRAQGTAKRPRTPRSPKLSPPTARGCPGRLAGSPRTRSLPSKLGRPPARADTARWANKGARARSLPPKRKALPQRKRVAKCASKSPLRVSAKRKAPAAGTNTKRWDKKNCADNNEGDPPTTSAGPGAVEDEAAEVQRSLISAGEIVSPTANEPSVALQDRCAMATGYGDMAGVRPPVATAPVKHLSPTSQKIPMVPGEAVLEHLADKLALPIASRTGAASAAGAAESLDLQYLVAARAAPETGADQSVGVAEGPLVQRALGADEAVTAADVAGGIPVGRAEVRAEPSERRTAIPGDYSEIVHQVARTPTEKRSPSTAGDELPAKRMRQTYYDATFDDTPRAPSSGSSTHEASFGASLAARFAAGSTKLLHFAAQKLNKYRGSTPLQRPPLDNAASLQNTRCGVTRPPMDWKNYRDAMTDYVQAGNALGLARLAEALALQNDVFQPDILFPEPDEWREDMFTRALLVAVEHNLPRGIDILLRCAQGRITEALREASRRGNDDIVRRLLTGATAIRWRDASEVLRTACRRGNVSLVRWIAGNIQQKSARPQGFLESGLLVGWKYGHLAVVDALLSAGANINEVWDERMQVVGFFCICCDGNSHLCTADWRCCMLHPNPLPFCGAEWRVLEPLRVDTWFSLWRKGLWENWDVTIAKYLQRKGAVSARDDTPQKVAARVAATLATIQTPLNAFEQASNERIFDITIRQHRIEGVNDRREEAELDADMDFERKKIKRKRKRGKR